MSTEKEYYIEHIYSGGYPTVQVRVRYDLSDGEHRDRCINEFSSASGLQAAKDKAQQFIDKIKDDGKHELAQLILSNRQAVLFWTVNQEIIGKIPINSQVIESMRILLSEYDRLQAMRTENDESEGRNE